MTIPQLVDLVYNRISSSVNTQLFEKTIGELENSGISVATLKAYKSPINYLINLQEKVLSKLNSTTLSEERKLNYDSLLKEIRELSGSTENIEKLIKKDRFLHEKEVKSSDYNKKVEPTLGNIPENLQDLENLSKSQFHELHNILEVSKSLDNKIELFLKKDSVVFKNKTEEKPVLKSVPKSFFEQENKQKEVEKKSKVETPVILEDKEKKKKSEHLVSSKPDETEKSSKKPKKSKVGSILENILSALHKGENIKVNKGAKKKKSLSSIFEKMLPYILGVGLLLLVLLNPALRGAIGNILNSFWLDILKPALAEVINDALNPIRKFLKMDTVDRVGEDEIGGLVDANTKNGVYTPKNTVRWKDNATFAEYVKKVKYEDGKYKVQPKDNKSEVDKFWNSLMTTQKEDYYRSFIEHMPDPSRVQDATEERVKYWAFSGLSEDPTMKKGLGGVVSKITSIFGTDLGKNAYRQQERIKRGQTVGGADGYRKVDKEIEKVDKANDEKIIDAWFSIDPLQTSKKPTKKQIKI